MLLFLWNNLTDKILVGGCTTHLNNVSIGVKKIETTNQLKPGFIYAIITLPI